MYSPNNISYTTNSSFSFVCLELKTHYIYSSSGNNENSYVWMINASDLNRNYEFKYVTLNGNVIESEKYNLKSVESKINDNYEFFFRCA